MPELFFLEIVMKPLSFLVPATLSFLLTSCGYLAGDEKQQLEQAWLAKDLQLQQAVEQIRTQGLEAVVKTAEAGSVASCVATSLAADPVGSLISVEGALVESAKVAQLLADLQQVMEQDVSLEQMAGLLQRGADAAVYAKTLIEQQGLEQALQSLKQMVIASQQFAQQDLGAHLQQLLSGCHTKPAE
jgi:hypothetical protein